MLRPKERLGDESFATPEHVARSGLPLPLRDHPMLDAESLAATGIGPAGIVPGGENIRRAGFEILVDQDPLIYCESCFLGEVEARPHADANQHEIGLDLRAVIESNASFPYFGDGMAEMKHDAMRFMKTAHEIAQHRSEDVLHGPRPGRDHIDRDLTTTQSGGRLKTNEARADDQSAAARFGERLDRAAVRKRPQSEDMREIGAGRLQSYGVRASRNQQL
jgi:hypothetical protein